MQAIYKKNAFCILGSKQDLSNRATFSKTDEFKTTDLAMGKKCSYSKAQQWFYLFFLNFMILPLLFWNEAAVSPYIITPLATDARASLRVTNWYTTKS